MSGLLAGPRLHNKDLVLQVLEFRAVVLAAATDQKDAGPVAACHDLLLTETVSGV